MSGRKAGPVEFIAGSNMGFRKSVLKELNGSQEGRRCAEDMELILRARLKGYRIYFVPDAVVTHDHDRTTLAKILKYSLEHASVTILLRNQYCSLLRTPFVLRSPALILMAAPVIALKVTAGIYMSNLHLAKYFWTAPMVFALKLAWCWGAACGLRRQYLTKENI
jgi:GT2 family glycosyltransferase